MTHRITRRRDGGYVEQIRLTQAQQQRRHGQYRDGQHQRPAHGLQLGDELHHDGGSRPKSRSEIRR